MDVRVEARRPRRHDRGTRPRRSDSRARGDNGQVLVLAVTVVLMITVILVLALAQLGAVARDRARARTGADAAALAGAIAGEDAAISVAAANDARLEHYASVGGAVEVTVVVGRARATSRATRGRGS